MAKIWYELQRKQNAKAGPMSATWVTITECKSSKIWQFDTRGSVSSFATTFARITFPPVTAGELAIIRREVCTIK